MKQNRVWLRALTVSLLLSLTLSAVGCQSPANDTLETTAKTEETTAATAATDTDAATDPVTEEVTTEEVTTEEVTTEEVTTAVPELCLTVDQSYRIVISAEADELTRGAADRIAAAIKEKTGLELTVVTDAEAPAPHELVVGYTNRGRYGVISGYVVYLNGESLHMESPSSTTLSYAADAVMEAWLTPDFGLTREGVVTLRESRVIDLNNLTHKLTDSVRVMTQNMRGDNDSYGNTIPERYERFCLLLADYQPDIIGSQEHVFSWYHRFQKLFENMTGEENFPQYGMVGSSGDGHQNKGGGRNVIFYRTDRFDLLETDTFWLSETPDVPSSMTAGTQKRICTWALLKDKQTEKTILVVNTHLDHTRESVRVMQIEVIMNFLSEKVGDYPVFFTGDFNAGSYSDTYGIVTEVFTDARAGAEQNLSTVSGTFHGYSTDQWNPEIDFIFHNDKSTPATYEILSKDYDGFVSDHYGVMVEFVMK